MTRFGSWKIAWCHTGDSGGSKRAAFEMVRELAQRGHVIDEYIVRIGEPNLQHWPMAPFVRESHHVVVSPTVNRLRPHLLAVWAGLAQDVLKNREFADRLKGLGKSLERKQYDLVHIDHCSPSYTVPLAALTSLPTVIYSHEVSGARYQADGAVCTEGLLPLWRRLYHWSCHRATGIWNSFRQQQDEAGLRSAGLILTNSHYSKEALFQRVQLSAVVCRYGVDVETFRPLNLQKDTMVLTAGRIVEAKQHHAVIEAVGTMPKAQRPRVVIATPESITRQEDPDYLNKVVRLADEAQVKLEIRRNPTEHDLVRLYNEALALVFVPLMEPFGLVALEAMSCGTPVIGACEGGIRESVVDGVTGLLVQRQTREIAAALSTLCHDRTIRERLGRQASEHVRREWTWSRSIDGYEREIERLFQKTNRTANG
jgi:glycosyltransferase involved in cell wall biosynthesis